jgi:predicted PurR-regulated permease PerM
MSPQERARLAPLTTLVGIIATIMVGWVLIEAAAILQPLVIAVLLCIVLGPLVRLLKVVRVPAWVTVLVVTAIFVAGVWQGGLLLYSEARAYTNAQGGFEKTVDALLIRAGEAGVPQTVLDGVKPVLEAQALATLGTVRDFGRGLLLVVIYMFFIFAEQQIFRRKILMMADARSEDARKVLESIGQGVQRYLVVKTVTSLATGTLCYTGLLMMEVPYALLFGFLTFLANYIPTFGSIAASVLPTMTALANFGMGSAAVVAGMYLAINVALGSIIEPRLLGRELNLSPLVILVSVVVWAGLWGVSGTFLAVPLTASAQIILANIESTRPLALMLSAGPGTRRDGQDDDPPDPAPESA